MYSFPPYAGIERLKYDTEQYDLKYDAEQYDTDGKGAGPDQQPLLDQAFTANGEGRVLAPREYYTCTET